MKIVFLSPSAQLGGAERVLVDAVASMLSLLETCDEIHVVLMANGPLADVLRDVGVSVQLVPMPARMAELGESSVGADSNNRSKLFERAMLLFRLLGAAWAVSKYVRTLKKKLFALSPDLIHSNGMKSHILSVWARPARAKVVWHVHDFLSSRPVMARRVRKFAPQVSAMIAISRAVADDLRSIVPAKTRINVVLNGIDTDHFSPAERSSLEADSVRVGLIATYARWKGQDVFIDAAALAKSLMPATTRLKFELIGSPIYSTAGSQFSRKELIERASKASLSEEEFSFVDFQPDPLATYQSLDIVVHASTKPEPFGRTIVEAMACGKAVVVSRAGGAAELFTDDLDAVGVLPGNPKVLAEVIVALATDPDRRDRLGSAARATAVERFDRPRMGIELLAVYRSLCGIQKTEF